MCLILVRKYIKKLECGSLKSPDKTELHKHTHSTSGTKDSARGQSNVVESGVMCSQWPASVSLDDGCEPVWDSVYHPG